MFPVLRIALILPALIMSVSGEAVSAKIDITRASQRIENIIIPDDSLPFIGFWKTDCSYAFGLALERAGDGKYSISFSGPSGGYPPGPGRPPTSLVHDPHYKVIDANTIEVKEDKGFVRYYRCADSRFFKKAGTGTPPAATKKDPEPDPGSLQVMGLKLGMDITEARKVRPDLRIKHLDPNLPKADWPDAVGEASGLKVFFANKKVASIEYSRRFLPTLSLSQWRYARSDLDRKYGLAGQFEDRVVRASDAGKAEAGIGDCQYRNDPDIQSFVLNCIREGSSTGNYFRIKLNPESLTIRLQDETPKTTHRNRRGAGSENAPR